MIGFLQTASGENSSTKLFTMIYGIILVVVWALLCWEKKEILPIDLSAMAPLGLGMALNSVNKQIDATAINSPIPMSSSVKQRERKAK